MLFRSGAERSAGTRRDVSPADCAARAEPSGVGEWPQADLPFPLPKSPKERVGGCVGALEHHKPHALPGAREARSRAEGVRRTGRPFPKCFPAPTGLRRACGPRGGARDKVASAPCRRPPASLSSATGDPNPHSVLGSLRRLPSRGSSMRKGTPLASRVAQGVSGPSSSCVWNPRPASACQTGLPWSSPPA